MGSGGRRGDGGGGLHPGAEGGGRARVSVTPLLGGFGGAACGEGASRGRVQELGWLAWGAAYSGFRQGLRPRPSLGEGPCASGCAGAGVGGGVGTGGSAFPAGSWGTGAGPGTPPQVPSAVGIGPVDFLSTFPPSVSRKILKRIVSIFFFHALPVSLALALVSIGATLNLRGTKVAVQTVRCVS